MRNIENNWKMINEHRSEGRTLIELSCNKCDNKKITNIHRYKNNNIGKCNICYPKVVGDIHNSFLLKIKENAYRRNLKFDITLKDLWDLFIYQNKKCELSGVDLYIHKNKKESNASLDRIDATKGYIKGNIRWVNKSINQLKSDFNDNEFFYICKIIYEKNKNEIELLSNIDINSISKINERKNKSSYSNLNNNTSKPILQYDLNGNFIKEWKSISEAVKYLNLKQTTGISATCRGIQKSCFGYYWEFKK
jgi:hypothetical protein